MYTKAVKLVSIAAFFLMFLWWFAAKSQLWSVGDGGYMELLALAVFLAALLLVAQTASAESIFGRSRSRRLQYFSTPSPR